MNRLIAIAVTLIIGLSVFAPPAAAQHEQRDRSDINGLFFSFTNAEEVRAARQVELQAQLKQLGNAIELSRREIAKLQAALRQQLAAHESRLAEMQAKRDQLKLQLQQQKATAQADQAAKEHEKQFSYEFRSTQGQPANGTPWQIGVHLAPADGKEVGLLITKVIPDSPAHKAGLKEGDGIVSVNDIKVRTYKALAGIINAAEEQPLNFVVQRQDRDDVTRQKITVTPIKREANKSTDAENQRIFVPKELILKRAEGLTFIDWPTAPTYGEVLEAHKTMKPEAFQKWLAERYKNFKAFTPAALASEANPDIERFSLRLSPTPVAPDSFNPKQLEDINARLDNLEKLMRELLAQKKEESKE